MRKIDNFTIKTFLENYRKVAFPRLFEDFKMGYQEAVLQRKLLSTQNEPVFNVFKILAVSWYEAITHTPLLRALLDPDGPHQQGALFLQRFLERCRGLYSVSVDAQAGKFTAPFPEVEVPLDPESWSVRSEDVVEQGRLDIVLRSPNLLCVIENKIGAPESEEQLNRYWKAMKREQKERGYGELALIFLTPQGNKALTGDGVPYFRLSYREDIYLWLQEAREEIDFSPHVRTAIDQYLQIVREIGGVSMEAEDKVTQYILRPEHLAIALDVEKQVRELRALNHKAFWELLSKSLSTRLSNSKYASEYEISAPILADYRQHWIGCYISERGKTATEIPQLSVWMVQARPQERFPLYLGVAGKGVDANHRSRKVQELAGRLQELEFNTSWWLANKPLNYRAAGDRFLLKMVLEQQSFVKEMADIVWNVFETIEPLLRAANQDLREGP